MPTIATSIFQKLTVQEKEEIKVTAKPIGEFEIYEYVTKSITPEALAKFIFEGLIFKNFLRDALLWDALKTLLGKIFTITTRKKDNFREVQIWLQDKTNPSAIDIAFSIKNLETLPDIMVLLRKTLNVDVFSKQLEQKPGRIIWIGYDSENKKWRIKTLE